MVRLRTTDADEGFVDELISLPEGENNNTRKLFVGSSPWYRSYTIPESALIDITDRDRFSYFSKRCPICGKPISGRPAEYPYYRKFGMKIVYLCDMCDELKKVSVRDDTGNKNQKSVTMTH